MQLKRLVLSLVVLAALVVPSAMLAQAQDSEIQGALADIKALLNEINGLEQGSDEWLEKLGDLRDSTVDFMAEHGEDASLEELRMPISLMLQCADILDNWDGVVDSLKPLSEEEFENKEKTAIILYALGKAYIGTGQVDEIDAVVEALEEVQPEAAAQLAGEAAMMPGREAPLFELADAHDEDSTVALKDFRGESYVLLDFWATWCGPCKSLMKEELAPLYEEYGEKDDFELIGISAESAEKQLAFADRMGYDWVKLVDAKREANKAYGVRGIPFLVLIDKEGKIVVAGSGWAVIEQVKEWLAETYDS